MSTTRFFSFAVAFEGAPPSPPQARHPNQVGTDYRIEEAAGCWQVWENEQPVAIAPERHAELSRLLHALRPMPDERVPTQEPGEDGAWYSVVVRDGTKCSLVVRDAGQRRGYTWWVQPPPEWARLAEAVEYVQRLSDIPRQALAEQNRVVAARFFSRLVARDVSGAMECCGAQIEYSSPFFQGLFERRGREAVGAMWRAWLGSLPQASISCDDIRASHEHGLVRWTARYTFPDTSRLVRHDLSADLAFAEGKIIRHRDRFGLHEWASQAYGASGRLLGGQRAFQSWAVSRERARLATFEAPGTSG